MPRRPLRRANEHELTEAEEEFLEVEMHNTNECPAEVEAALLEEDDRIAEEVMRSLEAWEQRRIDEFLSRCRRSSRGNITARLDKGQRLTIYQQWSQYKVCVDLGSGKVLFSRRGFASLDDAISHVVLEGLA
jgi:hypothetical protein